MSGRETFEALEVVGNVPWEFSVFANDPVLTYGGDDGELHGFSLLLRTISTRTYLNCDFKLDRFAVFVAD